MNRFAAFASLTIAPLAIVLATGPALAGPALTKRPLCQVSKAPRELKRPEPCRKPAIPPVVDPAPLFLASTGGASTTTSDLT